MFFKVGATDTTYCFYYAARFSIFFHFGEQLSLDLIENRIEAEILVLFLS